MDLPVKGSLQSEAMAGTVESSLGDNHSPSHSKAYILLRQGLSFPPGFPHWKFPRK